MRRFRQGSILAVALAALERGLDDPHAMQLVARQVLVDVPGADHVLVLERRAVEHPGVVGNQQLLLADQLPVEAIQGPIEDVDLIVELKAYTGRKIAPDDFRNVRTVGDVVTAVEDLLGNE